MDLHDSGRLDPRPQDVLFCRLVVFGTEALQVVQEAAEQGAIGEGIFGVGFDFKISQNSAAGRRSTSSLLVRSTANFPPFDFLSKDDQL